MATGESAQDRILNHALSSFQEEYKDLTDTWKVIDGKAQATGTIAGVFLAAAFAFARDVPAGFGQGQRALLCVGIGMLVLTVCLALAGLQIRRVSAPPIGENLKQLVQDLLPNLTEIERDARLTAFIGDQIMLWEQCNQNVREKTTGKARWVTLSQYCLLAAIVVVTAVTLAAVMD